MWGQIAGMAGKMMGGMMGGSGGGGAKQAKTDHSIPKVSTREDRSMNLARQAPEDDKSSKGGTKIGGVY